MATVLRKQLEGRGKARGVDLILAEGFENDIKDLAGCRVFYTNNDITKLINSGPISKSSPPSFITAARH